jgi:hypothetical protein
LVLVFISFFFFTKDGLVQLVINVIGFPYTI